MIDKTDQATGLLKLTLRQLEVFVATAREGSTRGAAQKVSRSQSAASSALAELETVLGVHLFDRVGRRLLLNENGRALLPKAAALCDLAVELEHLFDTEHAVTLRIAASLTVGEYLLPPLIAHWKTLNPASSVHLRIGNSSAVIDAVAAFEVEVGFIEGPLTHPDLLVRPWHSDEMAIVAAPGHPLARGTASHAALRQAVWALREPGSGTREAADRWLAEHLGPVHVEFEFGSAEALKRLVAAGDALGCLSRQAVEQELAHGTLVELRTRLPRARRRLALVVHRDRTLGRGSQEFVEHCMRADAAGTRHVRGAP
ncbi:LysR family transcriptional regulator [Ramlibacter sp. AN1015]|uniref:LysR family transcriptional regulator n=1 Tax=Ramlibacter sp. AN1015 TaxID=3133428 RepID=UPI0030BAF1B8